MGDLNHQCWNCALSLYFQDTPPSPWLQVWCCGEENWRDSHDICKDWQEGNAMMDAGDVPGAE